MAKKVKEEKKDSFIPVDNIETKKDIPPIKRLSLSNYKEPELNPMREKEILSRREQKDKELIVKDSKRHNVPLDMGYNPIFNYGKTINPSVQNDKKPDNKEQSARKLQSNDPAISGKAFIDLKGPAPQQEVPKRDNKQLMDDARKQRRSAWGDKLEAFGTGLGGGTYDWNNSISAKYQRKRDAQFQEYKDIVQNNQKVKEVFDSKNRDELIDFLDKQREKGELTAAEKARYESLAAERKLRDDISKRKEETDKARISSNYRKSSSSRSGDGGSDKIDLPFEDEIILKEMDEIVGKTSGASGRNLTRLKELSPESRKSMLDLSENLNKTRQQLADERKKLEGGDQEVLSTIETLNNQIKEYQNTMKSILNGKTPEAAPEKPTVNTDGYKSYYGKEFKPETKQSEQSAAPETQKKLDDFFN